MSSSVVNVYLVHLQKPIGEYNYPRSGQSMDRGLIDQALRRVR